MQQLRYRLRWRLNYVGRPSRYGTWDYEGGFDGGLLASHQPRACLASFEIEALSVFTGEITTPVHVPAHDYRACRVVGCVVANPGSRLTPGVLGIAVWTTEEKITVLRDGAVIRRSLTKNERSLRLREHSLGR